MARPFTFIVLAGAALVIGGCAKKSNAPEVSTGQTTSARAQASVHVSDDLAKACKIQFGAPDRAPKFDFDDDALLPEDRDILEQVAKCVATGPLAGRELLLVGHADPRGETEYNLVLGQQRAECVKDYLARLGVDSAKIDDTTRGELDAQGKDEDSWRIDRRVDILLKAVEVRTAQMP